MMPKVVNFAEKLGAFHEQWSPKIVAQLKDYHIKLVKVEGDFVWHSHPETDELFYVVDGQLEIEFRDGSLTLKQGEMAVIPKGVEHKPFAAQMCQIMLIEPAGTPNTGNSGGTRTAPDDQWI